MTNSEQKSIGEFELIDHGIEHPQCFQGCDGWVGYIERYNHVVTGIGENPAEAIDDCLEQVAQAGFNTEGMETRIMEQEEWEVLPENPDVWDECGENWEGEHPYYHVSIRWNEGNQL